MKVLCLKDDTNLIEVGGDALLLDVMNRCYYELNNSASFVLGLLEGGCSKEQLRTNMVAAYTVDPETAASDIDRFLAELSRFDLLVTMEEAEAPVKPVGSVNYKRVYHAPLLRPEARVLCEVRGRGGISGT